MESQNTNLEQILPLFSEYKVIVLGDRKFCSVDLGNWLKSKGVSFCLRLKKNHCIELEDLIWRRLDELGIVPGTSLALLNTGMNSRFSNCYKLSIMSFVTTEKS